MKPTIASTKIFATLTLVLDHDLSRFLFNDFPFRCVAFDLDTLCVGLRAEADACASRIAPLLRQKSICSLSPRLSVSMVFEQIGQTNICAASTTEEERDRLVIEAGSLELEAPEAL